MAELTAGSSAVLERKDGRLCWVTLVPSAKKSSQIIFKVDYNDAHFLRRLKTFGRGNLLAKAVGWQRNRELRIFDATLGWGRDAMLLAYHGCSVVACESHPIVYQLTADALVHQRLVAEWLPAVSRLRIYNTASETWLAEYAQSEQFDVIYVDPMFESPNSALPKKSLQVLRSFEVDSPRLLELFEMAQNSGASRIVVKRSVHQKPYADIPQRPQHTLSGRSLAFDIYLI